MAIYLPMEFIQYFCQLLLLPDLLTYLISQVKVESELTKFAKILTTTAFLHRNGASLSNTFCEANSLKCQDGSSLEL